MTYAQSYSRPAAPADDPTGPWRSIGKWSVAFALFLGLLAMFSSLLLFQFTAEGSAKRTLRRSVATLTEIDPLIDLHFDELQRTAADAGPNDAVRLPGYPIDVPLASAQVAVMSKAQLRDALLDGSAGEMYRHGTAALRPASAGDGSTGRFSIAGLTQHGLGFLRERNHTILAVTTFALAALCAGLAITLAAMCRGYGRLTSIGMVVLCASIPIVLAGVGARFYMRLATDRDNEFVEREFLEIARSLAWIPIRDGAAFAVFGLLLLLVGYACALGVDRRATTGSTPAR